MSNSQYPSNFDMAYQENDESKYIPPQVNPANFSNDVDFRTGRIKTIPSKELFEKLKEDVGNQKHYASKKIQPIEQMEQNFSKEEFRGFLKGNIFKYLARYQEKDGIKDLKKAQNYLERLIKLEEKL